MSSDLVRYKVVIAKKVPSMSDMYLGCSMTYLRRYPRTNCPFMKHFYTLVEGIFILSRTLQNPLRDISDHIRCIYIYIF